jgi:CO/xanthine dehydrogenase Mo-binding subunit
VRLLHPRHCHAGQQPDQRQPGANARRDRAGAHPNLCRCTGYKKVSTPSSTRPKRFATRKRSRRRRAKGRIGERQPKYDAQRLVLGQHHYVDDIRVEGMVYGALKFSDHPRARVLAIRYQRGASHARRPARAHRRRCARRAFIGLMRQDWPIFIAEGETTRYVGDVLATVIATDEETARAAVEQIAVEYDVLEPVTDPHEALAVGAPAVHDGGNLLSRTSPTAATCRKRWPTRPTSPRVSSRPSASSTAIWSQKRRWPAHGSGHPPALARSGHL